MVGILPCADGAMRDGFAMLMLDSGTTEEKYALLGFGVPGYCADCRRVRVHRSSCSLGGYCQDSLYHFSGVVPDIAGNALR